MIIVTLKSLKSLVTISEATKYHIVVKGRPDTIGTKLILCENAAPTSGLLGDLGRLVRIFGSLEGNCPPSICGNERTCEFRGQFNKKYIVRR